MFLDNSFCAKAEVLLLKAVRVSGVSLILRYLQKGQTQASKGTERGAQDALTGEPAAVGLDKEGSQSLPLTGADTGCSLLPKQPILLCRVPTALLTKLSL